MEVLMAFFLIALVTALLLPTMSDTWMKARTKRSLSNLHQIGILISDYQNNNGGRGARRTNGGHWGRSPDPYHYYWGAMYEIDKRAFQSPHTWSTSDYEVDGPRSQGHKYTDYGFNAVAAFWEDEVANFEVSSTGMARNLATYVNPSVTILAQDHFEATIDGNGDVPCFAFDYNRNALNPAHKDFLPDLVPGNNSETMLTEIFRNQNFSALLWADGHVSQLPITGVWDPRWYTGLVDGALESWQGRENGRYTQPPPYSYGNALTGRF